MELGCFSVSLTVKNIETSKAFYEKLGFSVFAGDIEQKYLIMKNGDHNIGLFEGMFEDNILTFNPGWNQNAGDTAEFTDVRKLASQLESQNIDVVQKSLDGDSGPGSFSIVDPDGNAILFDQHR